MSASYRWKFQLFFPVRNKKKERLFGKSYDVNHTSKRQFVFILPEFLKCEWNYGIFGIFYRVIMLLKAHPIPADG